MFYHPCPSSQGFISIVSYCQMRLLIELNIIIVSYSCPRTWEIAMSVLGLLFIIDISIHACMESVL